MSDYNSLWDADYEFLQSWSSNKLKQGDFDKLNNSSLNDIKICEQWGFPEPCIVEDFDADIGSSKFILSTIKDYSGNKVLFNVVKEK